VPVEDKWVKCKWKLKTTVQYEMVRKTDHSLFPNLAGMEDEVNVDSYQKKRGGGGLGKK
jgi:hypothetical protein